MSDEPPDPSSFPEEESASAPNEKPVTSHRSDRPANPLYYAPIMPPEHSQPNPLGYGRPTRWEPTRGHAASMFVLGMITPVILPAMCLSVSTGKSAFGITMVAFFGVPLTTLCFRKTRMFGIGWLTSIAVIWSAIFIICGGMNIR